MSRKLLYYSKLLKYEFLSRCSNSIGIVDSSNNSDRSLPIIVSFTSYRERLPKIHLTIETLFRQTMKPNKIFLYLYQPDYEEFKRHFLFRKLQERGLEIKVVSEDLKSYMKLIYAYREFGQNSLIITVDDDVFYPRYLIEFLYRKWKKFRNSVIAYRCLKMIKKNEKGFLEYRKWPPAKNVREPKFNIFATGNGSVLYFPNSLNEKVFDSNLFMKLAPYADDIYFKAMSILNQVKTITVFENSREFPLIRSLQNSKSLFQINVKKNLNDIQLKKVFDYFDLYSIIEND